jgi:hypothetical protein
MHMTYNLGWFDIRAYLKENFPEKESMVAEDKYQPESFGCGYIVYRINQKFIALNFDVREEQIFISESTSDSFDFRTSILLETLCLWEYSDKAIALDNVGQTLNRFV